MDALARLRKLFTEGFRAIDVASPLLSFDDDRDADHVASWMDATSTDVVGIRIGGLVSGYVLRRDLGDGTCRDAMRPFGRDQVLGEEAGLAHAVAVLHTAPHCFLATLGTVDAVLTRGDLQKPQGRMWLFGMITTIELAVGRTIELRYPEAAWKAEVSPGRLSKAEELLAERARRERNVDLLDCLQLSDKAQILAKDPDARARAGFSSKRSALEWIKRLESLRNSLAHSQDIVTHDWEALASLASRLDRILENNARIALSPD
jgi:hypothetical protein